MPESALQSRRSLDHELTTLRDNVLRMGHMVDRAIDRSVQAMKARDFDLARQVIADDQHINRLRYQTEMDCYRLLALQQPTARDLRAIVAAIHIVSELERIGDHAEAIARVGVELGKEATFKPHADILRMSQIAREMLNISLNAYLDWDMRLAGETLRRDQEIDDLNAQVYHELLKDMGESVENVSRATQLLWILHDLERIGDRIKNVCERVIFMVTGETKDQPGWPFTRNGHAKPTAQTAAADAPPQAAAHDGADNPPADDVQPASAAATRAADNTQPTDAEPDDAKQNAAPPQTVETNNNEGP